MLCVCLSWSVWMCCFFFSLNDRPTKYHFEVNANYLLLSSYSLLPAIAPLELRSLLFIQCVCVCVWMWACVRTIYEGFLSVRSFLFSNFAVLLFSVAVSVSVAFAFAFAFISLFLKIGRLSVLLFHSHKSIIINIFIASLGFISTNIFLLCKYFQRMMMPWTHWIFGLFLNIRQWPNQYSFFPIFTLFFSFCCTRHALLALQLNEHQTEVLVIRCKWIALITTIHSNVKIHQRWFSCIQRDHVIIQTTFHKNK